MRHTVAFGVGLNVHVVPTFGRGMTVTGTLLPFDRVEVTVIAALCHEKDMADTAMGHHAVCAMGIPFIAQKHMHCPVKQVGRVLNNILAFQTILHPHNV